MRVILLTIAFLYSMSSFSQNDTLSRTSNYYFKAVQHSVEFDPLSVWFNKGFSLGHRLKYSYFPNDRHRFSLETNGTWFYELDFQAESAEWRGVFPRLNRTQLIYELRRPLRVCKPKRFFVTAQTVRFGYQYFQHATGARNSDYWIIDSSVWNGIGYRTIAGFQSHSALLGFEVDVESVNFSKRRHGRSSHQISVDYLFSPVYQLHLYNSANPINPNPRIEQNFLPVNRSGGQFSYQYKRRFSRTFNFHFDVEAIWVPFLKNYQPNDAYFVPRGGEKIIPFFLNARTGFCWNF